MFDHNIFQDNLVGVDYCEQMVKATNPKVWDKAQKTPAPHAADHGYRTIADIMTALNPFTGEFYRETLHGEPVHPRGLLPHGGTARPSLHAVSGRRRHGADGAAVHRLPRAAGAVRRVHEEVPAAARRPVRLLVRRAAGLREGGLSPDAARLLGLVQQSRRLRLHLQEHGQVGRRDVRHPRRGGGRQAGDPRPRRHQPRHPDPARPFVLRRLGQRARRSSRRIRSAIRSISGIRGTRPRSRGRRSATSTGNYSWTMSPRWFDGKDHLALDTGGGPLARFWATALAGIVDIGYVKATGTSVKMYLPKTATKPEAEFEWKIPKWSNAHRAGPRPHVLPGLRRGGRVSLRGEGARGAARRPDQDVERVHGARRGDRPAGSTRRCAACCRTTW